MPASHPSAPDHREAPHPDAPHASATHSDAPHSDAPHSDAPHASASHSDASHASASHSDAPHVSAPPRPPAAPRSLPRAGLLAALTLTSQLACSPYFLGPPPAERNAVTHPFTSYLDSMASVCVIRVARVAMAVTFTVHDNDVLVGATRGPTWFCYRAEPGRHRLTITSEDGEQRFDVDFEARGRYYLEQGLHYRFGFVVPNGRWVDERAAVGLLAQSEHRVLQGVPASETLLIGTDVAGALEPGQDP